MIILKDKRNVLRIIVDKIKIVIWFRHVNAISQFVEKNIRASLRKSEDSTCEITSKRIVSIIHRP